MDSGIVYFAAGNEYQKECCLSAESVKNCMPDIPITVFSDSHFECEFIDDVNVINRCRKSASFDFIKCLRETPYDYTIYFDTDIFLSEDIKEVFDIIRDHDLVVVHDTRHSNHHESPVSGIPDDYPEFNSGVIGYKKNIKTIDFLNKWLKMFDEDNQVIDQPSMRAALYKSDLNIVTLPPEYNCLYGCNPGYLNGSVKVFHGRLLEINDGKGLSYHHDPKEVRSELNSTAQARVYLPSWDMKVITPPKTIFGRFFSSIFRNGVAETISLSVEELRDKIGR